MTEDEYPNLRKFANDSQMTIEIYRVDDPIGIEICLLLGERDSLIEERDQLMEEVDPKYLDALSAARNFLELFFVGKANAYQAKILEQALEKVGY